MFQCIERQKAILQAQFAMRAAWRGDKERMSAGLQIIKRKALYCELLDITGAPYTTFADFVADWKERTIAQWPAQFPRYDL